MNALWNYIVGSAVMLGSGAVFLLIMRELSDRRRAHQITRQSEWRSPVDRSQQVFGASKRVVRADFQRRGNGR